jgi:hypothetical protein
MNDFCSIFAQIHVQFKSMYKIVTSTIIFLQGRSMFSVISTKIKNPKSSHLQLFNQLFELFMRLSDQLPSLLVGVFFVNSQVGEFVTLVPKKQLLVDAL